MANDATRQGSKWLLKMTAGHRYSLILSSLLNLLGNLLGIAPYYITYRIIEIISTTSRSDLSLSQFVPLLATCALAVILKNICLAQSSILSHKSAYSILHGMRVRLASHISRLPLGYFNRKGAAQLKKVMCEDIEILELFMAHNIPEFFGAITSTLTLTLALFVVDWRMALASLALPTLGMAGQIIMFSTGKEEVREWYTAQENMNATMLQYIQGMPLIKAFNHTVDTFKQYSKAVEDCRQLEDQANKRWHPSLSFFYAAIPSAVLVIIPVGSYLYLNGELTIQALTFFLLLGPMLAAPLMILAMFWHHLEKIIEAQNRIRSVLKSSPLPEAQRSGHPSLPLNGEAVDFSYERGVSVLKNVHFSVETARFMALVGPSGAGKTTLARLIPRFWDVDSGAIRMGQEDIREIDTETLMKQMTFVFQNVQLFDDTIAANLRMGNPSATDEELVRAAKDARCHDFISALPQGYETRIGERGCFISGGEKQRLSIARAILKDAPIVVLDEATAFIDPENEVLIQEAINRLAKGKTLIVIAHRLSTITGADEIIVMKEGAVEDRGTHENLLDRCTLYHDLWEAHTATTGWTPQGGIA
ncbi:ABC transporter ATP-binding protein [Marinifilum sp. JC120]|nr:ABC transporter ATP-binding protein [Marinifilum sp. JC120]